MPEYKSLEVKELTAEGQLEAVISTFGRDRDGDVMAPEAFKNSNGKSIPMVWSHNWDQPVGKGTVSVDAKSAKFTGQFFLDTIAGEQAYRAVKAMGELQEYSIGFQIKDASYDQTEEDGQKVYTRTIKDIELFEASPVLVGAAYNTGTVAIKEHPFAGVNSETPIVFVGPDLDIHDQIKALSAQHAETCELGDECPLATKQEEPAEAKGWSSPSSERETALAELEAQLGWRLFAQQE